MRRADPVEDLLVESLLKASESLIIFRQRTGAAMHVESAVDLLIFDPLNPRSLTFQLACLIDHLESLELTSSPLDGVSCAALARALRDHVHSTDARTLATPGAGTSLRPELDEVVADLEAGLGELLDAAARLLPPTAPLGARWRTDRRAGWSVVIFRILHRTRYRYGAPVSRCRNETRLRPRETASQRCLASELVVDPAPVARSERADYFGNPVTAFAVDGPLDELTVTATSTVEVQPNPPVPEEGPTWGATAEHLATDRSAPLLEVGVLLRVTPRPAVVCRHPVRGAVLPLRANGRSGGRRARGTDRDDFDYEPGSPRSTTPIEVVLRIARGLPGFRPRRHWVPAFPRPGRPVRERLPRDGTAPRRGPPLRRRSLARLVSVFVPGSGWVDVDPTNARSPVDRYVTTAWGRDYADVSPLKGVVFGGGDSQSLDVGVHMARVSPTA